MVWREDPMTAARQLEDRTDLSPRERRALEAAVNQAMEQDRADGLEDAETAERYVAETTNRITAMYAECRSGYDAFADWLGDDEPSLEEARRRLGALYRAELNGNRLSEGVGKRAEDAARIKADPVGYMSSLRKKYPSLAKPQII